MITRISKMKLTDQMKGIIEKKKLPKNVLAAKAHYYEHYLLLAWSLLQDRVMISEDEYDEADQEMRDLFEVGAFIKEEFANKDR